MLNIISRRLFLSVLAVAFLAVPAVFAASEDEGLYDALPPEGSSFLRFIHAAPEVGEDLPPSINGKKRDGVRFSKVKPYGVIAPGKVKAALGPASIEFEAEPKSHYTLILKDSKFTLIKDPEITDPLKAQIVVYNTTSRDDITLKTADGKVLVLGPLATGEVKDVAVNPIKVSFAIYAGDQKFADLTDWPLERKESYIIAVMEDLEGKGVAAYDRARVSEE